MERIQALFKALSELKPTDTTKKRKFNQLLDQRFPITPEERAVAGTLMRMSTAESADLIKVLLGANMPYLGLWCGPKIMEFSLKLETHTLEYVEEKLQLVEKKVQV